MTESRRSKTFTCLGRTFTADEIALIQEVVELCSGLSQTELARTLADLLEWNRPSGKIKDWECRDLLLRMEEAGLLVLPKVRPGKPKGTRTRVPITAQGDPRPPVEGTVRDVAPVTLELVTQEEQRLLWRELVGRHHYLGHKVPFGAHLRYLIRIARPEPMPAGCLQFSSPAWRMAPRDEWIGWDTETRKQNLQQIVNNSRFLILPWVKVRNLASFVLALAARQLPADWERAYGIRPMLMETLVDSARFSGTCYRAANWVYVGTTTGRGRMDRDRTAEKVPKEIFLHPLNRRFRNRLRGNNVPGLAPQEELNPDGPERPRET